MPLLPADRVLIVTAWRAQALCLKNDLPHLPAKAHKQILMPQKVQVKKIMIEKWHEYQVHDVK